MSPFKVLKNAFSDFGEDQCATSAAALAYYTIFALPPLLILVLQIVGKIWNPDAVRAGLETQFAGMIGQDAAKSVQDMLQSANTPAHRSTLATVLAVLVLALGATGAFGQLQASLNRAWEVRTDPKQGIMKTVLKRIFSFGMVLGIAFMLLVSLAVSAALAAFGTRLNQMLPHGISSLLVHGVAAVVSFGTITLLFAMMFKFIPDAVIDWKDVWIGSAITALLFTIGKLVISLYLGHSRPGHAFGAASALAVLLVWIYYSGMIILFGAELTQSIMERNGRHIEPAKGAVKYVEGKDQVVEKPAP